MDGKTNSDSTCSVKPQVTDDLCTWSGHLTIKQPRNQLTTAGRLISKPRSAASMTPAWHYYSTGVLVDEAEWMNSFFRVLTQVKRQLGIDCGQKGSQYISYCRWPAASISRGEIDVQQVGVFSCAASLASGFGVDIWVSECRGFHAQLHTDRPIHSAQSRRRKEDGTR